MTDPLAWDTSSYRVISGEMVSPVIRELWLEPVERPVGYRPGQYILLSDAAFRVPQRSYSIANAPRADGRISILVTLVESGPTSTWAHGLTEYDEVLVEGPFGTFVTDPADTRPVLLLGAGSGLAPVRALAEALLDPHQPEGAAGREVSLVFSGRTLADAINRERFEERARGDARFGYVLTRTREPQAPRHTRVPEFLGEVTGSLTGWEVFAAGPPGFVTGCQAAARQLGAPATAIHTEEFFADPQPWTTTTPPLPEPR